MRPHQSNVRDDFAGTCGSLEFDASNWLCVQTHPQAEAEARKQLEQQGWLTYFPRIWKITPGRKGRFDWLFPRYGFVQINTARQSWTSIQHTVGLSGVVRGTNNMPAFVPQHELDKIRAAKLDRVAVAEKPVVQDFVGKRFSVLDGPWQRNAPSICTWSHRDRIKLLHSLFNRTAEVEYSLSQVKLVDDG